MNKPDIYLNDWLAIHPYTSVQPSDSYFVKLADRLYKACALGRLPKPCRKSVCLYVAAYLEDVISGLGLWNAFIEGHRRLYGRPLPFYDLAPDYETGCVNAEDVRFIIWNAWQKMADGPYIDPLSEEIRVQADAFYRMLDEVYEDAPDNPLLEGFFSGFGTLKEADMKLTWLFGHTYLTEPSMRPYISQVAPSDRMIMPTGPLALFLHEWTDLLAGEGSAAWKRVDGLYWQKPETPVPVRERNAEMFRRFMEGTGGRHIVYLDGYAELRRFLTEVLKWPDDDDHTLPQMKLHRNFVLMSDKEKGILLAKDVCGCIADPENPLYNKVEAERNAFRLLTEETLCPPDLLAHCIARGFLPDAEFPGAGRKEVVAANADFIARHSLLYYYRGD